MAEKNPKSDIGAGATADGGKCHTKQISGKDKVKQVRFEGDSDGDCLPGEENNVTKAAGVGAASGIGDGEVSKKKKLKQAFEEKKKKDALEGFSKQGLNQLLKFNPALAETLQAQSTEESSGAPLDPTEMLGKLKLQDVMTGLATSGKNTKKMGDYKFWRTQLVPQFDQDQPGKAIVEGPLKLQKVEEISKEPTPLVIDQFRWVTMDLTCEAQMEEVYKLLNGHYVEDDEAMFRFNYSRSILRWALMSPGWMKQWHVGIRSGNKLCAFISAIPTKIRVRENTFAGSEVNFLCVHKKLRNKRLAPVLIKEITRLINLEGIFQAIYTGGVVLPRPISTCRYFHRAINWQKLYEIRFSPCPLSSKPALQVRKYALPNHTATRGLREMKPKDLGAVHNLLQRYLRRYDLAPVWTNEETDHWLLQKFHLPEDQIVWSYVVEDTGGKITDFFSFYRLESSVIKSKKYPTLKAAYCFYYATKTGLTEPTVDGTALQKRLRELFKDALILAKQNGFDVFNALSLADNATFLKELKFGPGDGQLHYYLFNYKSNFIAGGLDETNTLDEKKLSKVGFVML